MAVPTHGLCQGETDETPGHGARPAPVVVDEQWLGTGHGWVVPHDRLGSALTPQVVTIAQYNA